MLKKLGFSIPLVLALTACGGGSDDDHNSTQGSNNGGNQNTGMKCDKGIPSGMAPLGKGVLDEQLYSLSTQHISEGAPPIDKELLIEEKILLNKHVLYTTATSINQPNAELNWGDDNFNYLLNEQGLFTTQNYAQSNLGWPTGYISQMKNSDISFTPFNDQCNLSIDASDHTFEKVDLSGQPISVLFEENPKSTEATPPNFIYSNYKYLENGVVYFLNPFSPRKDEEHQRKNSYISMIAANETFPAGSYIYVMKQTKQHATAYAFTDTPTKYLTLEDWAKNTYHGTKNWKTINVAGYSVIQAYTNDGQIDCITDPAILKDGKVYDGECHAANQTAEVLNSDISYYMNQNSYDALRAQLKKFYQM